MKVSPCAGKPAEASMLVNVPRLVTAYYSETPDPSVPEQRVTFGTSGHRAEGDEYTPTPAISHAILTYNRGRKTGVADGIVITPSHNPPHDGGFKYNPPNAGPAESVVTGWIEAKANESFENGLVDLKRIPFEKALRAPTTHRHDSMLTLLILPT